MDEIVYTKFGFHLPHCEGNHIHCIIYTDVYAGIFFPFTLITGPTVFPSGKCTYKFKLR